jgi:hypothetical protein
LFATLKLTNSRSLGAAQHDGLENDLQALHRDTGTARLDLRRDTGAEYLDVVERPRAKELEEGKELLDVVLRLAKVKSFELTWMGVPVRHQRYFALSSTEASADLVL